jgi:hypothetical protein
MLPSRQWPRIASLRKRSATNHPALAIQSFAHAALMAVQAFLNLIARGELIGSAVLVIIGVALIALAPAKSLGERLPVATS